MNVFVTGGSGFIGSRLTEVLLEQENANVTVLANRVSAGLLRVAAMGVSIDYTSITDELKLTTTLRDTDVVYHLAFGKFGDDQSRYNVTVEGTRALVNAAISQNVGCFVYVSTAAVYFKHSSGVVNEDSASGPWGWDYADEKFAAEEIVREAIRDRGLNGVIVQVAGVYGPWGENFTTVPLAQMATGKIVLPHHGQGVSNATYVDDVVQLLLLATDSQAVGKTYLVKGPGRHTRADFFSRYEAWFGDSRLELLSNESVLQSMSASTDWRALGSLPRQVFKALNQSEELKETIKKSPLIYMARAISGRMKSNTHVVDRRESAPGAPALIFPSPLLVDYLSADLEFSTKKAETELGFRARYSLDEGMALTKDWAKWARKLP